MEEKTIRTLCKEKGMICLDRVYIFVKFFMERFPNESDNIHSYCNEWIDRFMTNHPETYMDGHSLSIYNRLKGL